MNYQITVLRQPDRKSSPYTQTISYTCGDPQMSIATLLKSMNADDSIRDVEGKPVGEICYECSCLQKKCGACAMRINGRPRLACDAKLGEFKNGRILLEPLKKFPVIADLIVDRALMMENLKSICLWLNNEARHTRQGDEIAYEASRCLQCGCCLDVCPNFIPGEEFYSAAAFVPAARILTQLQKKEKTELLDQYVGKVYQECGKSLSCRDICPAGIDIDSLLVNNNAVAVWKRYKK
ncbi:MAG: 4Fe-4S dicluster domain-containing protein [Ruminococcus sp.]|nr:4Fe-4S dicluster domain-containing protein [Ruminococcus sp.]